MLVFLLLSYIPNLFSQKKEMVRIGPYFFNVTDSIRPYLPYLKYDGHKIIDTRTATAQEKTNLNLREKLLNIENEHKWYDAYWSFSDRKKAIVAAFENNSDEIYLSEINGMGYLINGTAYVEFADVLIDEANAENYRYHVVKNDKEEIVPWTKPEKFIKTKDGKYAYAYFGKFDYEPKQQLKVEVYNVKNYADRSTMFVEWVQVETPVITGHVRYTTPHRQQGIFGAPVIGIDPLFKKTREQQQASIKKFYNFIDTVTNNHTILFAADSLLELSLTTHNNPSLSTQVYLIKKEKGKEKRILIGGRYNKKMSINKELWKEPGQYKIEFVPYAIVKRSERANKTGGYEYEFKDKAYVYNLTVLPPKNSSILISNRTAFLLGVATFFLVGVTAFSIQYLNKRKLRKAKQKEALVQSQLHSIRTQLNPHFIFNALSSIQNLVNKNNNDAANAYLTRFSRLTRNVLDDAEKELITIEDEVNILEDYLQMEQIRFGFQYNIQVDESIDKCNVQIPPMLLQPLIENAVKHGVAAKKQEGLIEIVFSKNNNDLIAVVKDNGLGFDGTAAYNGRGLRLTKNRISLLNNMYKKTPLSFTINSGQTGTLSSITLKSWL